MKIKPKYHINGIGKKPKKKVVYKNAVSKNMMKLMKPIFTCKCGKWHSDISNDKAKCLLCNTYLIYEKV